jgi:hypothetical protein
MIFHFLFFFNPGDPLELIVIQSHVRFINKVTPRFQARCVIFLETGHFFFYFNAARKSFGLALFLIYKPQYCASATSFLNILFWLPFPPSVTKFQTSGVSSQVTPQVTGSCVVLDRRRGTTSKQIRNQSMRLWFSMHMKIKTMNLANLPVWIIVAIQIFHFGAGKCCEELIVVNSSMRLQAS